jgi:hypothetical protein
VHALAPDIPTIPSNEPFHLLHPSIKVDLLLFVDDFDLDIEIILKYETFNFHLGMFTTYFI